MAIDLEKLDEGLKKLRGLDFELAETQTRTSAEVNMVIPIITFTREFQARLASLALGMPYADITELPLREFNKVCQRVQNFLNSTSDDETPAEKSEV